MSTPINLNADVVIESMNDPTVNSKIQHTINMMIMKYKESNEVPETHILAVIGTSVTPIDEADGTVTLKLSCTIQLQEKNPLLYLESRPV